MAKPDDTSKATRSRRNKSKDPAESPSAATSAAGVEASPPTPPSTLEEAIEYERTLLLQVRAMLHCLYEVLLYADEDDSILHAEVAQTAARLLNDSAVRLDAVNLQPLIEAIRQGRGEKAYEDERGLTRDGPYQVKEAVPLYLAA
jgi:hypothetical protein